MKIEDISTRQLRGRKGRMRKLQPLEGTHRFVLLLRWSELCEQYSTSNAFCVYAHQESGVPTCTDVLMKRCVLEFHFAFRRGGFARLLATTVAGSHAHQKSKHKTVTVNAQSKRSLHPIGSFSLSLYSFSLCLIMNFPFPNLFRSQRILSLLLSLSLAPILRFIFLILTIIPLF